MCIFFLLFDPIQDTNATQPSLLLMANISFIV
jgi:hypothetical protein